MKCLPQTGRLYKAKMDTSMHHGGFLYKGQFIIFLDYERNWCDLFTKAIMLTPDRVDCLIYPNFEKQWWEDFEDAGKI